MKDIFSQNWPYLLTFYSIDIHLDTSTTEFLKTLWEKEKLLDEQFLHFPQFYQISQIIVSPFVHFFFHIISLFAFELEEPKFGM